MGNEDVLPPVTLTQRCVKTPCWDQRSESKYQSLLFLQMNDVTIAVFHSISVHINKLVANGSNNWNTSLLITFD